LAISARTEVHLRTQFADSGELWRSVLSGDVYRTYDRKLFVDTLTDWGWFGRVDEKPAWFTGESWT
jgi:hypothetical protein